MRVSLPTYLLCTDYPAEIGTKGLDPSHCQHHRQHHCQHHYHCQHHCCYQHHCCCYCYQRTAPDGLMRRVAPHPAQTALMMMRVMEGKVRTEWMMKVMRVMVMVVIMRMVVRWGGGEDGETYGKVTRIMKGSYHCFALVLALVLALVRCTQCLGVPDTDS